MKRLRAGYREAICVNSKDEKVDPKFLEEVRKDIEDYKEFLIKIGRL